MSKHVRQTHRVSGTTALRPWTKVVQLQSQRVDLTKKLDEDPAMGAMSVKGHPPMIFICVILNKWNTGGGGNTMVDLYIT